MLRVVHTDAVQDIWQGAAPHNQARPVVEHEHVAFGRSAAGVAKGKTELSILSNHVPTDRRMRLFTLDKDATPHVERNHIFRKVPVRPRVKQDTGLSIVVEFVHFYRRRTLDSAHDKPVLLIPSEAVLHVRAPGIQEIQSMPKIVLKAVFLKGWRGVRFDHDTVHRIFEHDVVLKKPRTAVRDQDAMRAIAVDVVAEEGTSRTVSYFDAGV